VDLEGAFMMFTLMLAKLKQSFLEAFRTISSIHIAVLMPPAGAYGDRNVAASLSVFINVCALHSNAL